MRRVEAAGNRADAGRNVCARRKDWRGVLREAIERDGSGPSCSGQLVLKSGKMDRFVLGEESTTSNGQTDSNSKGN